MIDLGTWSSRPSSSVAAGRNLLPAEYLESHCIDLFIAVIARVPRPTTTQIGELDLAKRLSCLLPRGRPVHSSLASAARHIDGTAEHRATNVTRSPGATESCVIDGQGCVVGVFSWVVGVVCCVGWVVSALSVSAGRRVGGVADSTGIKGDSVGLSGVLGVGPVVSAGEFRSVFRGRPGGVAVVTADAGDGPVGLTATCVVPVSVAPAMLAFWYLSSCPVVRLFVVRRRSLCIC